MSNWKEVLKAQQESLQRMEDMDAEITFNHADLDTDINNVLKYPTTRTNKTMSSKKEPVAIQSKSSDVKTNTRQNHDLQLNLRNNESFDEDHPVLVSSRSESSPTKLAKSPSESNSNVNAALANAPDTAARLKYLKSFESPL